MVIPQDAPRKDTNSVRKKLNLPLNDKNPVKAINVSSGIGKPIIPNARAVNIPIYEYPIIVKRRACIFILYYKIFSLL